MFHPKLTRPYQLTFLTRRQRAAYALRLAFARAADACGRLARFVGLRGLLARLR